MFNMYLKLEQEWWVQYYYVPSSEFFFSLYECMLPCVRLMAISGADGVTCVPNSYTGYLIWNTYIGM